jgi:hypothetical protein
MPGGHGPGFARTNRDDLLVDERTLADRVTKLTIKRRIHTERRAGTGLIEWLRHTCFSYVIDVSHPMPIK